MITAALAVDALASLFAGVCFLANAVAVDEPGSGWTSTRVGAAAIVWALLNVAAAVAANL